MSAVRPEIYLHVGAPKTGTTFLQSVLWGSRKQLCQQGVTLPGRGIGQHAHAALDVREMYDEKTHAPRAHGGLDRFAEALADVRTPRALFSMEIIAPATPEQIDRFYAVLADFDIHVIITARDLARQIPSTWQQHLQRRVQRRYDAYLATVFDDPGLDCHVWRSQDIAEVARRWGASLTPDRVHIVTVPPPGAPKSVLLERFCSVIGVDPASIDTDAAQPNSSLSAPQAELMRRVNVALGERLKDRQDGYNQLAKGYLAREVLSSQPGPGLVLPVRYADRCRELSTRMVEQIRTAGYHVVGDLADMEPTVFGDDTVPAGAVRRRDLDANNATVAAAGVQAIAAMLQQRYDDLAVIADLKQRLADNSSRASRQRRRIGAVRRIPARLVGRLPRMGAAAGVRGLPATSAVTRPR
ncbi:MAG: hypothetical protein ACR2JT_06790 [Nocardioidaceae bacterium]